jgi:hypothetical protein
VRIFHTTDLMPMFFVDTFNVFEELDFLLKKLPSTLPCCFFSRFNACSHWHGLVVSYFFDIVILRGGVNQYQVQFKTFFNLYLNHSTISNEQ